MSVKIFCNICLTYHEYGQCMADRLIIEDNEEMWKEYDKQLNPQNYPPKNLKIDE